jgi:hypothetical protein
LLPTVFEWCALSDFFMPDALFHAYTEKKNGCVTTRGRFSVAHAVCKDWFVVLYKRILAHCLRADYDMRVLRNNTGGILKDNHVMVRGWRPDSKFGYLYHGGLPFHKAYNSGVELVMTMQHFKLYAKWKVFLKHRGLQRIFNSKMSGYTGMRASTMVQTAAQKGRFLIKFRELIQQVISEEMHTMLLRENKKNGKACLVKRAPPWDKYLPIPCYWVDKAEFSPYV